MDHSPVSAYEKRVERQRERTTAYDEYERELAGSDLNLHPVTCEECGNTDHLNVNHHPFWPHNYRPGDTLPWVCSRCGYLNKYTWLPNNVGFAGDPAWANVPQTDPKKQYGDRKLNVGVVPPTAILAMARALGEGAEKYGALNWRSDAGVETLTYYKGALRHLFAWFDGEDVDPDSPTGKTHLEGAIASLAILIDAIESGYAIDTRPAPGGAPEMLLEGARHAVQ